MASERNLSIGITVNLDNFENLRLEASGEVSSVEEAEELVTFLDQILSRLGRGSAETAERVDAYRRRVFSLPKKPGELEAVAEPVLAQGATPQGTVPPDLKTVEPLEPPIPTTTVPSSAGVAPQEVSTPQGTAPLREETITCERCGAQITPIQRKLSQLFQNKDLCKKCLSQP